jgi:hypothetical protein
LTRADERGRLRLRLGRGGRQAYLRAERVDIALLCANQIGSLDRAKATLRKQKEKIKNEPIN